MKKIIYITLLLLISITAIAQTDHIPGGNTQPPATSFRWINPTDTNARQLYINWGNVGGISRSDRIPRFSDLQAASPGASNGITKSGNAFRLGGSLNRTIEIEENNWPFYVGNLSEYSTYIGIQPGGSSLELHGSTYPSYRGSTINLLPNYQYFDWYSGTDRGGLHQNISMGALYGDSVAMVIKDDFNYKGLEYYQNYRHNFRPLSLVDKQYVDSVNSIPRGDTTHIRNIFYMGSSFTLGPPQALLTSDTSTFAYKTTRLMGGVENNMGVGSRTLQQITVGDNSLYSNIASIPQYTPGSVLIIEPQVNDVVGDTTKYTTAIHTTQLTAFINAATSSKGWPANPQHIVIFNPFYYNFTAQANHGSIPYRHSIYNAAEQGVATSLGVGFLDLYSTEPHQYVYQDSLHSNGLGHTWAAGQLATYLTSQSIPIYNYNAVKNKTVGNSTTYGDQTVNGQINVNGPVNGLIGRFPVLDVDFSTFRRAANFLNTQNSNLNLDIMLGSNNGSPLITANTAKGGAIMGYDYADITNPVKLLSYSSASGLNTLIAGQLSGSNKGLQALDFYGTSTTGINRRAIYSYLATGHTIIGGGGADVSTLTVNQPTTDAGTITVTAGGTAIVGTGTLFSNAFKIGQTITANGETHTITAITNNTNMTTDAWTNAFTGAYTLVGGDRLRIKGNGSAELPAYTVAGGVFYGSSAGVISETAASTTTTVLHGGSTPAFSSIVGSDLSSTIGLPTGATAATQTPGTSNTTLATTAFTADVINTATDANYTITSSTQLVKLPVVTAARTVTLPVAASYTGRLIRIWNQNTSGTFLWTFASTVKDATNATITAIANTAYTVLESDGTNWNKIN